MTRKCYTTALSRPKKSGERMDGWFLRSARCNTHAASPAMVGEYVTCKQAIQSSVVVRQNQGAESLPDEDESKIREKVFDQIPLDDLKSDDGFTVLLNFLDKHLAKTIFQTVWRNLKILKTLKEQRDSP